MTASADITSGQSGDDRRERFYSIEFLRLFFIAGIAIGHIGAVIDPALQANLLDFFHTKYHMLWFGVEGFFIIGGFFLFRSIDSRKGAAFEHIKKLWVRLAPAMIFAVVILSSMGIVPWWKILNLSYFLPGTGLSPEVIWNSEWFICVYFLLSCLMIGLFNFSNKLAWVIISTLTYFAMSLLIHAHPVRFSNVIDEVYYTLITNGACRGLVCMSLGMGAAFVSQNLNLYKGKLFRIAATCLEAIALYMLFNYMLRASRVRFSSFEVELVFAVLMISIANSWGYISAIFNRMSWIQLFSRYTYPFLIGHALMIKLVCLETFQNTNSKAIMVAGGGILLGIIEYHLVEKFLVPKIKSYLSKERNCINQTKRDRDMKNITDKAFLGARQKDIVEAATTKYENTKDILRKTFLNANKKDVVEFVLESYKNIDAFYRRAFWIIFGILCLAFGFHTIQFMWGDHDWEFNRLHLNWWLGTNVGRYAMSSLKRTFLNGVYLPIIYDFVSFLFLALNAVLLCAYWKLEKRIIYFVLCGLILTAQPFTLGLMYFVHTMPETFIGVTLVLAALILSERIAFKRDSFIRKGFFSVLAIILINLSLATYPVILNTIAVAFVGRLLIHALSWDSSAKQPFRSIFVPFITPAVNIALGVLLYKIMLTFIFLPDENAYNVQIIPLKEAPERLLILLRQSFTQLYEYDFPFISQGVLWVFLGFTILVALHICFTGNIKQKIVRLILLGGALYATQSAIMVAGTYAKAVRIDLFGLVVFETLVTVIIFTKLKKLHNLSVLAATGVVWVSVINDLDCLRAWKLGFDAEKMLWNRVLARMETQKDFDVNRKYKIISIGRPISLRHRFYGGGEGEHAMITAGYDTDWWLFNAHEFYYQTDFRSGERFFPSELTNPAYKSELKRLWEAGILDKACAWPHENGLIVWKDIILFITDAKLLDEYKQQLSKEFPKRSPVVDPVSHVGNNQRYLDSITPIQNSPLKKKKILFLGSSVTQGAASLGVSFVDMLKRKYGCETIKEAVGGTCLAECSGEGYISRLKRYTKDAKIDLLVVQLSTNDAQTNVPVKTEKREGTQSIEGAITYIAEYGHNILSCPVIFFTSPYFGNEKYKRMCDCLRSIADTKGICIVDIFRDGGFEMLSPAEFRLCMFDPIHPTQAGYLRWLPLFEAKILSIFSSKKG